jgi:hypothetical protein
MLRPPGDLSGLAVLAAYRRPDLRISRASSNVMCLAVPGCCLDWNLDQLPMGLQQTNPTYAGSKVGLEVIPIDNVTLSDGRGLGERAPTRR